MTATNNRSLKFRAAVASTLMLMSLSAETLASETRQFAVSWVYYGVASVEGDCPKGLNPNSEYIYRNILKDLKMDPAEIEKLVADFPSGAKTRDYFQMRGRIDGKPVNVYVHPTSIPDPMLHLVEGTHGLGFNLDGKEDPDDFIDPVTGERGVDNNFFRAIGCSPQMRAEAGKPGPFRILQWDELRDSRPSWLIELTGIDSYENDDDVGFRLMLAHEPNPRDVTGAPQADMTYHVNHTTATANNVARAKIVNGMLITDSFDFYMPGEAFDQVEYVFKTAKMRFNFTPEGGLKGVFGGYQKWKSVYAAMALGGTAMETLVSYNMPGFYYAFRKVADAGFDPATGMNEYISSTYGIEAIPAFIVGSPQATAAAEPK